MSLFAVYCVAVFVIDLMIIGAKGDPNMSFGLQFILMYVLLFFGIPFVAALFAIFILFGAFTPSPSRSGTGAIQPRPSDYGESAS